MQIVGLWTTLFVSNPSHQNMKQLPTLPSFCDEEETSSSSLASSKSALRPTFPVDTELEVAEITQVELQRPGARVNLPLPSESDEEVPFFVKDGLTKRVEPLPAPLESH